MMEQLTLSGDFLRWIESLAMLGPVERSWTDHTIASVRDVWTKIRVHESINAFECAGCRAEATASVVRTAEALIVCALPPNADGFAPEAIVSVMFRSRSARYLASRPELLPHCELLFPLVEPEHRENISTLIVRAKRLRNELQFGFGRCRDEFTPAEAEEWRSLRRYTRARKKDVARLAAASAADSRVVKNDQ